MVDNLELLYAMDTRYPVSERSSIQKELDQLMIELKTKISTHMQSANAVSLSDIWSKKGLTSLYLAIIVHFFYRHRVACHNFS